MAVVIKREGDKVSYNIGKIKEAIFKALCSTKMFEGREEEIALEIACKVDEKIDIDEIRVETIQDIVENTLMESELFDVARNYIKYRLKREILRSSVHNMVDLKFLFDDYIDKKDWEVSENANMDYSLQGLNNRMTSYVTENIWLEHVYPEDIGQAHRDGRYHIHDLGLFAPYCCGWDIEDILIRGFGGVKGKPNFSPPKHFKTALGQVVNYIYTLQGEAAGAQAVSSLDTYLAPLAMNDNLGYEEIKQEIQTFVCNLNVSTRVGFQCPFSNITFDLKCPSYLKDRPVIIGGKMSEKYTYGDCQEYMDLINKAFVEVMSEGDSDGRIFSFPIPTYNITEDIDWDSDIINSIMELTAKYGTPYFQNFIGSDLNPEDFRSMCCRLRLDNRELMKRGGGLFGSAPLTGSIGVVTINMANHGYRFKHNKDLFFKELDYTMDLAKKSLMIKRKVLEQNIENGLYPYSRVYLSSVKEASGSYWNNHFGTIGINGMNECIRNFTDDKEDITTEFGQSFTLEVLDHMNRRLEDFQEETGLLFNLEATPAESTSYRLAQKDKSNYKDIICQGTENDPYYTNSTQLPVNFTSDIFEALDLQEEIQSRYTGGCVEKGTLIFTNKGILSIEYIHENFEELSPIKVISYNKNTEESEMDIVIQTHIIDVSKNDKIRVKGEKGLNIVTSDWHPFFVIDTEKGIIEKRADELIEGDMILCNSDKLIRDEIEGDLTSVAAWSTGFILDKYEGSLEAVIGVLNINNVYGFIEGIIKDSETNLRRGRVVYETYSEKICRFIMNVLTKIGITFEVIRENGKIKIEISLKELHNFNEGYGEKKVKFVKVTETYKEDVDDEMFYDLTVANNHNYLASNGSVFVFIHNTVFHGFFKDKIDDVGAIKSLIKNILYTFKVPYITYTPTFSICKTHGYLKGEEELCPICNERTEVWSRIVGFFRPLDNWNKGKIEEYKDRKEFTIKEGDCYEN